MLDALGDLLNPYSEAIGAVAGTVTTMQSFSGMFFLNKIRKRGSADGFSPAPFIGGITNASLTLRLSTILKNTAMIRTNVIGILINFCYLSFFIAYTSKENRPAIWKTIKKSAIFVIACITYATFEDPAKIEFRFGVLLISLFVVLLSLPLLRIKEIIRTKSADKLPFPMILSASVVVSLWVTYAISLKRRVLIYQYGVLLLLLLPQLILCLIYPGKPSEQKKSDEKSVKKD